jgi:hypothetical protein
MKYILTIMFVGLIFMIFWVPICVITWNWDENENGFSDVMEGVCRLFDLD